MLPMHNVFPNQSQVILIFLPSPSEFKSHIEEFKSESASYFAALMGITILGKFLSGFLG